MTYHVGFAAAERDGGAMHGPYGFELGHVTCNNLREKNKNVKGQAEWQNWQVTLLTECCLVRAGVSSHTVSAGEAAVGGTE